jgi:hypothetical protein
MKKLILAVALMLSSIAEGQATYIPQEEKIANNFEIIFNGIINKNFKSVKDNFYNQLSDTGYYLANGVGLNIYEQSGYTETINGNHDIFRQSVLSKWIGTDTVTNVIYNFSNIHSEDRRPGFVSSQIILILKSGRNIQIEINMSLGYVSTLQMFNNYQIDPELILFVNFE